MKISYTHTADEVYVLLDGELDTPATIEIQPKIDEIAKFSDRKITIDCKNLAYMASSGLRLMISLYKKCNANGGHLVLRNVNADIYEILSVTHFNNVFDIQQ